MSMRPVQPLSPDQPLARRAFLKLSGFSLLGLWQPLKLVEDSFEWEQAGRVTSASISLYDRPSFSGKETHQVARDTIVPITYVTVGDHDPAHNRVWYRLGNTGYAHSGNIQPVDNQLNQVNEMLPRNGALAEVTVPFTDARSRPGMGSKLAYRYYYGTTHWVVDLHFDSQGSPWYRVKDDRWDISYYAQAEHLRLIAPDELALRSPDLPPEAKRIEVDLENQSVTAYEWDKPVLAVRAATGLHFANGKSSTPLGTFETFYKRPSRHMVGGSGAFRFDLPGVPWVCYFTDTGVAFHGTYWHNDYGRPRSHGCINLPNEAAKWLYCWTQPFVSPEQVRVYEKTGTRVDIF
jgi:hypothetical protein